MLTSYLVSCPHAGCNWFGSLLPAGGSAVWRGSVAGRQILDFRCPKCGGQWAARVVGDDIEPLPVEDLVLAKA